MLGKDNKQLDKLSKDYWINKVKNSSSYASNVSVDSKFATSVRHILFEETEDFDAVSNNKELSKWVIFLSIYSVLLKRYFNDSEPVIFGSSLGVHARESHISGFMLYETVLESSDLLKELLVKVKNEVEECSKYKPFPIEDLKSSCHALGISLDSVLKYGLSYEALSIPRIPEGIVGFELKITTQSNGSFVLEAIYNSRIYSEDLVQSFLSQFAHLLKEIKNSLTVSLYDVNAISEKEREVLLHEFNDTQTPYPKGKTLVDLFDEQALKTPQAIAVKSDKLSLTYSQLSERVNRFSNFLIDRKKITPNDLVAIMLDRSVDFVVSVLAVLKSGAAYLPVDINYPADRIQYMLQDSGAKLLITEECHDVQRFFFANNVLMLDKDQAIVQKESSEFTKTLATPQSLVYVIYTSGSTGKPKGVMVRHDGFTNLISWYSRALDLSEHSSVLLIAPVSFDLAQKNIFAPLVNGSRLYLSEKLHSDYSVISSVIEGEQINIINSAPSAFYPLLHDAKEDNYKKLSSLSHIVLGGEPINLKEFLSWAESGFCHAELMNSYGPTECTDVVSFYKLKHHQWHETKSVPIGVPIDNTELYILDSSMALVPIGVSGEIYCGGVGVSAGYLGNVDLTTRKFINNPFGEGVLYTTGDLGYWSSNGTIEYIGRTDDQVKIRGFRIELGEIESVLKEYPTLREAVVIPLTNDTGEKYLVCYAVADEPVIVAELRTYLSTVLPDHMIPSHFMQIDAVPLTPSGKLDRKALAERTHNFLTQRPYIAPRNNTEAQLTKIWEEVLGIKQVGVSDDFFERGGHSLKIIQLISRIRRAFRVAIEVRDIFNSATIEQQAAYIATMSIQEDDVIPVVSEEVSYELSHSQKRMWILSQFVQSSLAYNISNAVLIEGVLDHSSLEKSFKYIISRHESLRTVFRQNSEGEPRQFILDANDSCFFLKKENIESTPDQEHYIARLYKNEQNEAFDLTAGPLLRAKLISLSSEKQVLFFTMHHIISDGWSMQLLTKEVVRIYNDLKKGAELSLQPLRIQYKDYAAWQNQLLASEKTKAQEKYWLEQFTGELPVLDLALTKKRPLVKTHAGATLSITLHRSLTEKLRRICLDNGSTLFTGLLASLNGLFYRYTNQEDIIIGTPVAGREQNELEEQIGLYLNILALRTSFIGTDNFLELLKKTHNVFLSAYSNRTYPFDMLVDKLNMKRDISRSPLFDVLLVLHNQSDLGAEKEVLPDIKVSALDNLDKATSQFDLSFEFKETENGLNLKLIYNTDIYSKEEVDELCSNYIEFLSNVLSAPQASISEVNILDERRKNKLLYDFNDTEQPYAEDHSLIDLFVEQVEKNPDAIAAIHKNKAITFRELDQLSNQLGNYLINLGVQLEDLIPICMDRNISMLIGLLGIMKSGAAYVPVDPEYPEERILYMLQNSQAKFIVSNSRYKSTLPETEAIIVDIDRDWETITQEDKGKVPVVCLPQHLAYMIYTSGSTGKPKGVMIEHRSLVNFIFGMDKVLPIDPNDHLLSITSISFDISILEIFWTLCKGVLVTISNNSKSLNDFDRYLNQSPVQMDFSLFYFSSQGEQMHNKYDLLLKSATFADQNDFKAVWLPERHFHEFGGIFPSPAVLGAALSTITKHAEIRSGSIVLPLHDVLRVAEEWSVIDNLSGGRVALSIASGWHPDDFVLNPQNYSERHKIMYENIVQLKSLWNGDSIKRLNGVNKEVEIRSFPRPLQQNLPIYITAAGNSETFKSAGAIGAKVLTHLLGQDINTLEKNIRIYKDELAINGHDVSKASVALMLHTYIGAELEQVKHEVKAPFQAYLRSSINLLNNLAKDLEINLSTIDEIDLNNLLEVAFERYWQTSALLGTQDSCSELVEKLYSIGVTEIACLIDFGIEDQKVINGLTHLNELRKSYQNGESGVIGNTYKPVTSLQITPSYLSALSNDEHSKNFLSSLKHLIVGGEKLSQELLEKLKLKTKADIYNMFGPTETTIWSSVSRVMPGEGITIGRPIQNTSMYVLDTQMNLCPIGVPGELYIGGKGLARGYHNEEQLTAERFIQNPFQVNSADRIYKTGDLVKWLPTGELHYIGRKDNQVKIRGYRIELGEIEYALQGHQNISSCVVMTQKSKLEDHDLVAYVVGKEELNVAELRSYLSNRLPSYMLPSYYVELDKLPLTPNGKIDRKSLPSPEGMDLRTGVSYVAPRDAVEEKLLKIWKELLGEKTIGVKDSFFDLGGHSLKATLLVSLIHKEFEIKLSLKDLFLYPVLEDQALLIKKSARKSYRSIEKAEEALYYPLSSAQKRLYFLQEFAPQSTSYNMPLLVNLGKEIDKQRLLYALKALIARHEILRTSFQKVNDEVYQKVEAQVPIELDEYSCPASEFGIYIQRYTRSFDLSKAPLLRSCLVKVEEIAYVWMIDVHHIISDGTSHEVLKQDFTRLYNGEELAPLELQYKDFAVWKNRMLESGELEDQKVFWQHEFSSGIPKLNFLTDRIRPTVFTFEGKNHRFDIDKELTQKVRMLTNEYQGTLQMTLLAVLTIVLNKYSGAEEISIGCGAAGRRHQELERLVGMFVNMLVVKNSISDDKSFGEFYRSVIQKMISVYDNQDLQFEDLVDLLQVERDASRNPLFDVSLVVQNYSRLSIDKALSVEGNAESDPLKLYKGAGTSKFDMTWFVFEEGDTLSVNLEYYSAIYEESSVIRLAKHFIEVLRQVVADPSVLISDISLLTKTEELDLLEQFVDGVVKPYDNLSTLHGLLEFQSDAVPHRLAIEDESGSYTYAEVEEQSNQLAHFLANDLGLQPESRVGLLQTRGKDFIVSVFGVLKAGLCYVPLDITYPEERMLYMLQDSSVEVLLTQKAFIESANKLQWRNAIKNIVCVDSSDVYAERGIYRNELMRKDLWNHVGDTAADEVLLGGWSSSFTGEPLSNLEMEEYSRNAYLKLAPYLNKDMKVLEIGCSSGITMLELAPHVKYYHGTDLSDSILNKTQQRVSALGYDNISLTCLVADQIDQLPETDFDLVIINSVIQCFDGHNYLREVLIKAIGKLKQEGLLFLGDLMDEDRRKVMLSDLENFKETHKGRGYRTKTNFDSELFVSKSYLNDLMFSGISIASIHYSEKLFSIHNELTDYRYDALLKIDKTSKQEGIRKCFQYDLKALNKQPKTRLNKKISPHSLAYVIYTSGTTGVPKGVMVEHIGVINTISYHHEFFNLKGNERFLQFGTISFDTSVWEIFGCLGHGSTLYVIGDYDKGIPSLLENYISNKQIEVAIIPPTMFKYLSTDGIKTLKRLITGGDVAVVDKSIAYAAEGGVFYNAYGPTEISICACTFQLSKEYFNCTSIPIGKPISNSRIYILDDRQRLVPVGIAGEICIGGIGLARGYQNKEELTQSKFIADPFKEGERIYRTGDKGRWLADGNIEYLGRLDDQVKIRGYRVELGEIESHLRKHDAIEDAVVVARKNQIGELDLVAYVLSNGNQTVSDLRSYLSKYLPDYMLPNYYVELDGFKLNSNGKINKKILPDPDGLKLETGTEYVAPRNETETKLVKLWEEILNRKGIGIHDNFFDLGGHSLKATRLVSKIKQEFGVEIGLKEIFQKPTIQHTAEEIAETQILLKRSAKGNKKTTII